eukprot:1749942-Prymnesium_polylepis.1
MIELWCKASHLLQASATPASRLCVRGSTHRTCSGASRPTAARGIDPSLQDNRRLGPCRDDIRRVLWPRRAMA